MTEGKNVINRLVENEIGLLSKRMRKRPFFLLSDMVNCFNSKALELMVRPAVDKIISSGVSAVELLEEYNAARPYYDIILLSRNYVFVRHRSGLSIIPLNGIRDVEFTGKKLFLYYVVSVSFVYDSGKKETFEFLYDYRNINGAVPLLPYERMKFDLPYLVKKSVLALPTVSGQKKRRTSIEDADTDDCCYMFQQIAEKECLSAGRALEARKKAAVFLYSLFAVISFAYIYGVYLIVSPDAVEIWAAYLTFPVFLFAAAGVMEYNSRVDRGGFSADYNVFLSAVRSSVISASFRSGVTCEELGSAYLGAFLHGELLFINGRWLILREPPGLVFINLDDVLSVTLQHEVRNGVDHFYYLIFRRTDGYIDSFEIRNNYGRRNFSPKNWEAVVKKALMPYPWIIYGDREMQKYESFEKMAVELLKKQKAFYEAVRGCY